ncbi:glycosyltransferase family 39 protein [Streptomyces sp. NPDC002730]|uniref:glycosyltransferase family 39 protein n=1 Tax=Streptomyces sp. NPDC002730 TaxID=3364662 RepID=UPI003690BCB3
MASLVSIDPGAQESTQGGAELRGAGARRRLQGLLPSVWLWPSLLTLVLMLFGIGGPQLWWDELTTWQLATRSTAQLWGAMQNVDAVHGTYYLIMHGWIALFGDAAWVMRLPSALAMVGTTVCVALIGRRLFSHRAGLAAGVVFALLPSVTRFGQEARSYALVAFVVALATWLLLQALDGQRRWGWWSGYAVCLGAIGMLHLVALTIVVGHALAVLMRARSERQSARRLGVGFGLAALIGLSCVVPLVSLGMKQAERQIAWLPAPGVGDLFMVWQSVFKSALLPGVLAVLAVVAVWVWPRSRDAVVFCSSLVVLPTLVVWEVSQDGMSYFDARYFVFTLPAWALLAGAAIAGIRYRVVLPLALVMLAFLAVHDQRGVRGDYAHQWVAYPAEDFGPRMDYKGAARIIRDGYRSGDAVVYDRPGCHYTRCDLGVTFYLPRDLKLRDVFLGLPATERNDLTPADCPAPAACLGAEPRIWLVAAWNPQDPIKQLPAAQAQALREHYVVTRAERVSGLTVALLQHTAQR